MENIIRYLYEYREGRRIRNVGFVKASQDEERGMLQIHGRATLLNSADIKVYLFYMHRETCFGILMGELHGIQSILSAQLAYDREEVEKYTDFDAIRGVILDAGVQGMFAAVWDESVVPIERMLPAKVRTTFPFPAEEVQEPREVERPKADEDEKAVTAVPVSEAMDKETGMPVSEAADKETGAAVREATDGEAEGADKAVPDRETEEMELEESGIVSEELAGAGERGCCRRIRREDIAGLHPKDGCLANNSFLMHGYYNYRHLLLIEDGEEQYIGVPGIYHPREARAACNFGFPEFREISEAAGGTLHSQEGSHRGIFGYWCRKI